MVSLAGYENFICIHNSSNSQVYRARRVGDTATVKLRDTATVALRECQPVILKFLNQDYPTPEQIRRYKQEYHLTFQLDAPGIIKAYGLEEWQRSYVMILEDFGGISLKQWLKQREQFSLQEFLAIAIAITESLGQIHAENIIHKDINPANIVFNPQTKELKIIDFGIATQLNRENPTLKNPHVLEGTLAYISPEQTGRMNRNLDYRTDFYSLGVTFYELLTETLPFTTEDVLELIHCHIAKMPEEIDSSRRLHIPQAIIDIVMKLMAKNAEDRYQSAYGLKADLENCSQQLEETQEITAFALGQQDISDRLQIPQKLYGREKEIEILLAAFDRVVETGKIELLLVAGHSGIGKSALVQELYKPITVRRGYFIAGKFDQFQRNIPYSAIVSAFRRLIRQLLGESEAQLQIWRKKLLNVLGNNGQVIIDVIPEVELIIGKQPSVPILGANEAQNRFNLVIGNFICAFCNSEHPCTLFLDDLQWADLGTLKLIERLFMEDRAQYLLLLGAYRDNEISLSHPLAIFLDKLQQDRNNKNTNIKISLNPLPEEKIVCLLGDTLDKNPDLVSDLSHLILQKTEGNPFFINEFLQALYREELLKFNHKLKTWQWNIVAIKAREFTDNVVDLMVEKLKKLPTTSQEILSFAACWGVEFDLNPIAWVGKKSPQETCELLKIAINLGLIMPLSEPDEHLLIQSYKFSHDRIQQAAYSLIPEYLKASTHVKIGEIILANTTNEEQEDKIFDIVSQMNYSINSSLKSKQKKAELINLNIKAGEKAQASTAYDVASYHFNIGISLLSENCWDNQYKLALFLYNKAAEVACMNGEFSTMEAYSQAVLKNAKLTLDKINIYEVIIQSSIAQNQALCAVTTAIKVLEELGEKITLHPQLSEADIIINKAKQAVEGKNIKRLVDLPLNQEIQKLAIVKILTNLHSATFFVAPQLSAIEICLRTFLCVQYGNSQESAHTYADYGLLLCGAFDDIETGYTFGQLAIAITEKFPFSGIQARGKIVTYYAVSHWKESLRNLLLPLKIVSQEAIESGDLEYAGYGFLFCCAASFLAGLELTELSKEIGYYSQVIAQIHQQVSGCWSRIYYQTVLNLLEDIEQPWILSGDSYNEYQEIPKHYDIGEFFGLFIAQTNKLILAYLFENYERAGEYADIAKKYVANVTAHLVQPCFFVYDSLLQLEFYANPRVEKKQLLLERVDNNQERLKLWGHHCAANYLHKYYLVEAKKCQVLKQYLEAMEFYDRAIAGAKQNKYLQEEALANELAAKFYLDWGKEKIALVYLQEAYSCYTRWGAKTKIHQLEAKYPQFLGNLSQKVELNLISHHSLTINAIAATDSQLDLTSAIKASQALSEEIELDALLAKLMNIVVENAGAQRGILILPRNEDLLVTATAEAKGISVLSSRNVNQKEPIPIAKFTKLSAKIVYSVARIHETVVLNNATQEGEFTDDCYIQKYQCQSIACMPLIHRGKLQGIIYLENNLTKSAFDRGRMTLLQTLTTQAAISLENARFYDACQRFVPSQFLELLEKKSIVDVKLGDQVEREMTVLFSDIRDFTTTSEQMTPSENFTFINGYLEQMEPLIQKYGGFIDKYIGDAIMALFSNTPDDALQAAIAMLEELKIYNSSRQTKNLQPIHIGIGLHTGKLILGTVGGSGRMDGTAIGDSVNLSSRVEGLTKTYGIPLLITHQTLIKLNNPFQYDFRFIDKVKAKGKAKTVSLFEVFSADLPDLRAAKNNSKGKFEKGVILFYQKKFAEAVCLFQECLEACESDRAACNYLERCHQHII